MIYFLDTSIIIEILRKNEKTRVFLASNKDNIIITSTLCAMEIFTGIYKCNREKRNAHLEEARILFESFYDVISFNSSHAQIAGEIKADLSKSGEFIGDMDILIASTALANQAIMVTSNPKHFSRIKNLKILSLESFPA